MENDPSKFLSDKAFSPINKGITVENAFEALAQEANTNKDTNHEQEFRSSMQCTGEGSNSKREFLQDYRDTRDERYNSDEINQIKLGSQEKKMSSEKELAAVITPEDLQLIQVSQLGGIQQRHHALEL